MLATQTVDGDLFLWSVSKTLGEAPRVIRSLKKTEAQSGQSRWLGWSKSGRIIQYCEGLVFSFLSYLLNYAVNYFFLARPGRGTSARSTSATSPFRPSKASKVWQTTGLRRLFSLLGRIILSSSTMSQARS